MPIQPRNHALFQHFPIVEQVTLSTGPAPTPYHVYSGLGVFISGTADARAVAALLAPEQVRAMTTTAGRALMGVWVLDFPEASLGPHHELQFSLLVARQAASAVPAHPLALSHALLARPEARLLCHGLWNDTAPVVAYNREVLGLNAQLCQARLTRASATLTGEFAATATGQPLLSTRLWWAPRAPLRPTWDLMQVLGFSLSRRLTTQPWVEMKMVNPIGLRPRNEVALAANHSAVNFIRYFDPRRDQLAIGDPAYRALDFEPQAVQQLAGIQFVYLNPQSE